jgi:hypothetical protein
MTARLDCPLRSGLIAARAMTRDALPPLYTRAVWTACAVHLAGAMSLAMFVLLPLLIRALAAAR